MTVQEIKDYVKTQIDDEEIFIDGLEDETSVIMHSYAYDKLTEVYSMLEQLDNEWVSVDDESMDIMERYPDEDDEVICINEIGSKFFAYYDDYEGEFLLAYDAKTPLKNIIAWRKDVEPYKREE